MTNKPPYTITEKSADYLAKIVETVTKLEYATDFNRNIRLHRLNRVRTIYSSLAIEGNSLSLGEVTAVIEGKLIAGKQTEIKYDAIEAARKSNDSGVFIEFTLSAVLDTIVEQDKHQVKHQVDLTGTQIDVLKSLQDKIA